MSATPDADAAAWRALEAELDCWAGRAMSATFWWRDDDAHRPCAALDRLLALCDAHAAPVALAVVPAWLEDGLAGTLSSHPGACVLQHGFAHVNHARQSGETGACEVGLHRGRDIILAELSAGRERLAATFQDRFVSVLTPPWNRIDEALFPDLAALGYRGVSVYDARTGRAAAAGLIANNCHCDPVDWKAAKAFRGAARTLAQLTAHLAARRERRADPAEATGLLTHHRDMDAATWAFTERLLETLSRHPAARWMDARELFQP